MFSAWPLQKHVFHKHFLLVTSKKLFFEKLTSECVCQVLFVLVAKHTGMIDRHNSKCSSSNACTFDWGFTPLFPLVALRYFQQYLTAFSFFKFYLTAALVKARTVINRFNVGTTKAAKQCFLSGLAHIFQQSTVTQTTSPKFIFAILVFLFLYHTKTKENCANDKMQAAISELQNFV